MTKRRTFETLAVERLEEEIGELRALSPEVLDVARELEELRQQGASATMEIVLKPTGEGQPAKVTGCHTRIFKSLEELAKRRPSRVE